MIGKLFEWLLWSSVLMFFFGGCASEEKRDAWLPSTVRNVEISAEKTLDGIELLRQGQEAIASGQGPEAIAALESKVAELRASVPLDIKNALDANLPVLTKAYDKSVNGALGWVGGIGAAALTLGAGRKKIGKVITGE